MSAPAVVVHVLLALQRENDPDKAAALIASLDNPFLRRRVRDEWTEMQDATVTRIEAS